MNLEKSLLSKIKSKYIFKEILSLAYDNMKSVLKLTKYNKCLLNKLDIKFKDYFKYEIETKTDINKEEIFRISLNLLILGGIWFIINLIYIILFYKKGKFNDKNLKEGYSEKKKDFVDFMDNCILLAYFIFNFATILIATLFIKFKFLAIKGYIKLLIYIFINLIILIYHIFYILKFIYSQSIIKDETLNSTGKCQNCEIDEERKENDKYDESFWFYRVDIFIIIIIGITVLIQIIMTIMMGIFCSTSFCEFGERTKITLNKFKGLNIIEKGLPKQFNDLNEKEKNEFIFKKEKEKEYQYKLTESQINLIKKINDIRKGNHIPLLIYYKIELLPEFIINEKTQLIFNDNETIFRLSDNFYVFRYPINQFQNYLNNNQILNIITIETLNIIKIIEQNNFEFISIYDSVNRNRRKNNIPKIHMDTKTNINFINTEDKLKEISDKVSVTEMSDNEGNEMPEIRNIKINNHYFEKNNFNIK